MLRRAAVRKTNLDEQILKDLESDERMVMVPVPLTPGRTQWIWQELMQSYPYCGESFVCPWCLYALIPSPKMIYRPSPQCIVLDLVILGSEWGGLTDADWAARLFRALFEITMSLSSDRRKLAMDGEFFSWPCRYVLFGHRLWSISRYIQTALKETYPIEILRKQNRKIYMPMICMMWPCFLWLRRLKVGSGCPHPVVQGLEWPTWARWATVSSSGARDSETEAGNGSWGCLKIYLSIYHI